MIQNNILINTETRALKTREYEFLGVAGENEVEQLVFKLTAFIDGIGIIEIQKNNDKYFIELRKQDDSYVLDIKNSLLSDADEISMQLHITTENTEVFKSKIFRMKIYKQIHATETIPDEYPEWIDTANAKIQEMLDLESRVEQAEDERNQAVREAINTIHDLTEEYNDNAREKTEDFDEDASNKKQELEDIAEVVRDLASSMQYASFRLVPQTGQVQIKQPSKMSNTRWRIDKGHMEVKII